MAHIPKYPPKPPPAQPAYVNVHGEPFDVHTLRRLGMPRLADAAYIEQAAPAEILEPAAAPSAAELETVFDALCLAGGPRGKNWLAHFLRHLDTRSARGEPFTLAEVEASLAVLRSGQRVASTANSGPEVPEAQRLQRLPALLATPVAATAWRAWVRASAHPHQPPSAAPTATFVRSDEPPALARLALYSGMGLDAFLQARTVLGQAAHPQTLATAVLKPFMPALFERMDDGLRQHLLTNFAATFDMEEPIWQPLMAWAQARLHSDAGSVPAEMRGVLAECCLHAGDMAACNAALVGMDGASAGLVRAAQQAWAGHWGVANTDFGVALKEMARVTRQRRGLASAALLRWVVLSLMAQNDAASWAAARKFCVAESGSRTPESYHGWGMWAHAIAVRLGDEPMKTGVFEPQRFGSGPLAEEGSAERVILAAWLGHRPAGWTAADLDSLVRARHAAGRAWQADLLRQACARLGWAVPVRAGSDGSAWPVSYYGRAQDAWQDALAAIAALGAKPGAEAPGAVPTTLQWHLRLDAEGRSTEVAPMERVMGARGLGKAKPVSLTRVKKSERLDPRDATVARCIGASRWLSSQLAIDVTAATVALVGHPGLYFSDAPEQPVDLREALPVLEVQRQRSAQGDECFVFKLADPLLAIAPPKLGYDFMGSDEGAEAERRNGLRVFSDGPGSARLIRISPAQRRVAELVAKQWAVPVAAQEQLDAALRVLAGHFQLHSDADGGQAVAPESRLRAQLSPSGDGLLMRLLVQPFGSFGPAVVPGRGRARLMTLHEGLSLSTERDLAAERTHQMAVLDALPFLADDEPGDCSWRLDDPEQALQVVERLPQLPGLAGVDWPRGKPVRVISVAPKGLKVSLSSGTDWFAIDAELRVDETRVLSLQRLLQLVDESRRGRFVALGEGEYLALTDQLRQQLADLKAMGQTSGQGLKLPATAAAWLAQTLEGSTLTGDKVWSRRLSLLDEAAALNPVVPATLQAELRNYQTEGFAWMARLAHAGLGACLADDMGLGKTVQTLALLLVRAALGPQLVIAPTSVCANWVAESERFAPSLRVQWYGQGGGERATMLAAAGEGDLIVASYALAQQDVEEFAKLTWATLVLDEAQALKNAATKRAKSVATLNAGFRLALTGTPVENRLADLWSIMNLLNPGLLGSSGQFTERFAGAIERDRDEATRTRLRRLISPFLLRRTKAQVLPDLPPRTEIVHRIEPGPEERSFLEATRRSAIERVASLAGQTGDAGAGQQATFHVLAELTRMRRAACDPRLVAPELGIVGAKVQEFEQLALELVAGRHKALVFSQFTDFLALLGQRLQGAGIRYQYLDGSTPAAERGKRVAAFQRGEGDLFLISLKAGGFGLNLTAADYVLIVDPWWNPAAEDQAMGRAHRIGQQRPVTVYRLVTAGSIEERIVEMHQSKRSLADGILEGQDSSAPLGADDLRALLRGM